MGCLFTVSLWPAAATSASTQRGWQLRLPDGRTLFVRDRQGCSQPLRPLGLMFSGGPCMWMGIGLFQEEKQKEVRRWRSQREPQASSGQSDRC